MNRRKSLKLLLLLSLTPYLSFSKVFISENEKKSDSNEELIEPMTGITIGLSVAKLFLGMFQSSSGPSIIDFIKNTNERLDIINKKIDILFTDIENIKKLILELPTEVVSKLKQVELKGRIDDYKAVLLEVSLNTYNGDIIKYMNESDNKAKVSKIVDDIKKIKAELRQINDPFLVSFIAIAIHIEYYLRNNFLQQKWVNFIGDIANDSKWLHDYVFDRENSLKKNISSLRATRKKMLEENNVTYSVRTSGDPRWRTIWDDHIFSLQLNQEIDNTINEEKELETLRNIGLLLENEKSLKFTFQSPEQPPYITALRMNNPQYSGNPQSPRDEILNNKNNNLKLNYYSIIASVTTYYSGLKAIEFCNIYLKAANYNK